MFHAFSRLKTKHQLLVAVLIAFAVISFWRGLWGIMDTYLFPDNYALSIWASTIMGLAILVITGYATKELL